MIRWFRRKFWQIKNVIKWLPKIWDQYDFDYIYSIEVFKFQLQKQAEFLESDKAMTLCAKNNASRIRMIIRLMDKVYDEDYALEYQSKFEKLYGKNSLDMNFNPIKNKDGYSTMKYTYELNEDEDEVKEIDQVHRNLFLSSVKKQKRAHKLLWDLIEHNIQGWWD
jgi:hypothetical protein